MREAEYKRLKGRIEEECRKKLEALELVWRMSNSTSQNGNQQGSMVTFGKGALQLAVRNALQEIKGDFTLHDIEKWIRTNNQSLAATLKRASLSGTLKRLEEKTHEVEIVSRGSGKRASTYRKAATRLG